MYDLIARLHPTRFTRRDWLRNIVSLRKSVNLFDDLVKGESAQAHLQAVEADRKPADYAGRPIIDRPFGEAAYLDRLANAVEFPFRHPGATRFSDGAFGVWYGANSLLTGVYETAYHWMESLVDGVRDRPRETHYIERRVYRVRCTAALLDLRPQLKPHPELMDKQDYGFCQTLGRVLYRDGYPGVLNRSARTPHPSGLVAAVFDAALLTDPRDECFLSYAAAPDSRTVRVERSPGRMWREITV